MVAVVLAAAMAVALVGVSGLFATVIWHRRGGSRSHGLYLGLTQPIVGVAMALWLTPDADSDAGDTR